jgi:hypothetical protein
LLRFYFRESQKDLDKLSIEDWGESYSQLMYALEFDGRRKSGEKNLFYPTPI